MQRRGDAGQSVKGQGAARPKPRKASTATSPKAELQEQLDQRTRELEEALEQQAATSEVLRVVSRSAFDLQAVFDTLVESAARLCRADRASIRLDRDGFFHHVANHGYTAEQNQYMNEHPIPAKPDRGSVVGRVLSAGKAVQIEDTKADPDFRMTNVPGFENVHTTLGVPLLREGKPIGMLVLMRGFVEAFTEKQIELVETFAAQAVIAIENTRLLNEQRESLQQQTATADVLKVISRSTFDLQTVLDTLVESSARLCEAYDSVILLRQGECLRIGAHHGPIPIHFTEWPIGRGWATGRAFVDRLPVHVHDLRASAHEFPDGAEFALRLGHRTILAVPLLRENEAIGALAIRRTEVKPFTDKQIELVQTFADQAVIAIENVRLFDEVQARTRELSESLEQQTATSEVLKVISSSPGELEPVFQAMLENAVRICDAKFGHLWLCEGDALRAVALHGAPQAYVEERRKNPVIRPAPATTLGRALATMQPAQVADVMSEPRYFDVPSGYTSPQDTKLTGARTILSVPMLKDNEAIGAITIYRQEVKAFTDKQIELVKNFAAQAVIAIENTRLLNELRESLQQQTATADVLKVISSSPGTLDPVFSTMLAKATELCEASHSTLWLHEEGGFCTVALHGDLPPAWIELRRSGALYRPGKDVLLARVAEDRRPIQVADLRADPSYLQGDPLPVAAVDIAGIRTLLVVPMIKESELVGAIAIYRREVLPFTDKQIELVKNFAAQAVIAIENTRLLNELRDSLQQQTATADVLKVISRSAFDLKSVLTTLVESAAQLCEADMGNIARPKAGGAYQIEASCGQPDALKAELIRTTLRVGKGSVIGRTALNRATVHILDAQKDPDYELHAALKIGDYHTMLGVPLLREGNLVGVFGLARQTVRPFTQKQIELVTTFADQAVIAIENARLFEEVQKRTEELTESLEKQTATSEVLKVISSSPGELEPVFNAMLANATRICEATFGNLFLREGSSIFRAVAVHSKESYVDFWRRDPIVDLRDHAGVPLDRVTKTKQVVHVSDLRIDASYVGKDTRIVPLVEDVGARTFVMVPMLKEGEIVGTIAMYRQEVRPFTENQIELLTNFAAQAVIAIENTRLLNELRESLQQQTATADVLKVISRSTFNLQEILNTLVESAAHLCDADIVNIWRPSGSAYRLNAVYQAVPSKQREYLENVSIAPGRGSCVGRTLLSGGVVHIEDIQDDPEYSMEVSKLEGTRTMLGVPLLREGIPIGVIALIRSVRRPFTEKQIELVKTFADQAVIAIENVRLFEEVQARTRELSEALEHQMATGEVLNVISRSPTNAQPVFNAICESASRLCDAVFSVVWRYDGNLLHYAASHNFTTEVLDHIVKTYPKRPDRSVAAGRAILDGRVAHVPDMLADPGYAHELALAGNWRASISVPMLRDGKPVGAISVGKAEAGPFSERQMQLLTTFADQAVIAIENVRLFDEVQARTRELSESLQQQTATADVLKVISRSTFDLPTVLQTLIESAARLCDADKGNITREKDGVFFRAAESYGYSRDFVEHVKGMPIERDRGSATGRAILEKRVIHIPDVKADPEYTLIEGQRLGDYRTVLAVPMLREGVPLGVLTLTRSDVRPFNDKQIELVTTFADQAAIAIENVRLFESVETRTRELARSLEDLRTTQDRLVQTQKLASLGQLTAGIAHEIKNPLNFVNNFSGVSAELIDELQEALKDVGLNEKRRDEITELMQTLRGNLDKVVQHGRRADAIVKNMLLHSREGSGEHRVVDINALVEESLNLAYHGARAEKQGFNITMERSLDPAAGQADVFPQDITRVLLNLVSNGFYAATKRGADADGDGYEPALMASTRSLGDRVEIRVRDNGTGIPPEVKEKMFNPFFTTKPAGEGTGLGLSICYDIIVKQHGGSIEVDTRPGEFTEIKVILPRVAALIS